MSSHLLQCSQIKRSNFGKKKKKSIDLNFFSPLHCISCFLIAIFFFSNQNIFLFECQVFRPLCAIRKTAKDATCLHRVLYSTVLIFSLCFCFARTACKSLNYQSGVVYIEGITFTYICCCRYNHVRLTLVQVCLSALMNWNKSLFLHDGKIFQEMSFRNQCGQYET